MPINPCKSQEGAFGFEKVVTLRVGSEGRHFVIHEDLLCQRSGFFVAAVKANWKEGQEHLISLADDKPEVFELYARWMYTSKISCGGILPQESEDGDQGNELLVDSYNFGEKIQDGDFKDTIIDALILDAATPDQDGATWFPSIEAINLAYQGTPVGSPLRTLLVDFFVYCGDPTWFNAPSSHEFLTDVIQELYAAGGGRLDYDPTCDSSCKYHQHNASQQCYRGKANNEAQSQPNV